MRARWRHLSTKICAEGDRLILFLSFSNGQLERKRARYQQRNLMDCLQNYRCTFHFIRYIRQTAVMSILKLKIIRHNHTPLWHSRPETLRPGVFGLSPPDFGKSPWKLNRVKIAPKNLFRPKVKIDKIFALAISSSALELSRFLSEICNMLPVLEKTCCYCCYLIDPLKVGDNRHSVNNVYQMKHDQILPQGETITEHKSLNQKEAKLKCLN